jgi:hypothetical protein
LPKSEDKTRTSKAFKKGTKTSATFKNLSSPSTAFKNLSPLSKAFKNQLEIWVRQPTPDLSPHNLTRPGAEGGKEERAEMPQPYPSQTSPISQIPLRWKSNETLWVSDFQFVEALMLLLPGLIS